jgi:flagellar assembly protein FliH
MASVERQKAIAFAAIGDRLTIAAEALLGLEGRLEQEAVEIAVAAAKRLALGLIGKSAEASVEQLLHELLAELRDEPRITLRVNDQIAEVLGPRIDTLATQEGFAGTVQLIPDSGMAPGNCRIEWGAGGVERSIDTIAERIDAAVAGYLAANAASG